MIPVRHIDSIKIWRLEDFLSGKDMVQPLHRHSFYYILALQKGAGEHIIDFVPYKVTGNSVFLLRPGQVHQLTLKKQSTGYLVQFGEDFYPTLQKSPEPFKRSGHRNFCALDAGRSKKLFSILAVMLEENDARQERYLDVIRAGLEMFFIELWRQCHQTAPADPTTGYIRERLEALLALIERHISTHKEVAWYAGKLQLTSYQLNAATKTALGKTCSEVIDAHIVLEAKRHLLATSNQVKQIAGDLGYEDVSYFIRFFRKHTGYSPESFRQHFG